MDEERNDIPSNWLHSLPSVRFQAQVHDEVLRLHHQILHPSRKQIVADNPIWGTSVNATANVRTRWQRQGIWRRDWESKPDTPSRPEFVKPLDAWPHEVSDAPHSSASRPYQQFNSEVMLEVEWIIADMEYYSGGEVVNLVPVEKAVANVKRRWIEEGIWNPFWVATPGTKWIHEQLFARDFQLFPESEQESAAPDQQQGSGSNQHISYIEESVGQDIRSNSDKENRGPTQQHEEQTDKLGPGRTEDDRGDASNVDNQHSAEWDRSSYPQPPPLPPTNRPCTAGPQQRRPHHANFRLSGGRYPPSPLSMQRNDTLEQSNASLAEEH